MLAMTKLNPRLRKTRMTRTPGLRLVVCMSLLSPSVSGPILSSYYAIASHFRKDVLRKLSSACMHDSIAVKARFSGGSSVADGDFS